MLAGLWDWRTTGLKLKGRILISTPEYLAVGSRGWRRSDRPKGAAHSARRPGTGMKNLSQKFSRNPLISLDSDERIQGNPSFSNPHF
jgi:hypothetical protein